MKPNPTHFIDVFKCSDGLIRYVNPVKFHLLNWSIEVNSKHGFETIAIFKIYPKNESAKDRR